MSMGYQGWVKLFTSGGGTPSGGILMLTTGSSVNYVIEPIFSNTVWGAGWYNAPVQAHYADGAIRFEGGIDIEVNYGVGGAVWDFLTDWAINERAYPRSIDISPDGVRVHHYWASGAYGVNYDDQGMWCDGMSLSVSEGSFMTASLTCKALDRSETDPGGGTDMSTGSAYRYIKNKQGFGYTTLAEFTNTGPLNPGGANINPIPFWRTNAQLLRGTYTTPFVGGSLPQSGLETVEWSADLTNNSVVLYTANGTRLATALLMGAIDATGSLTLYNEGSVFDPITGPTGTEGTLTSPYMYGQNTWFRVTIATTGPNLYIELPAVVITADDFGVKGQNDVTNRGFTIQGLGGRTYSTYILPPMLMSDSSGNFVAP